MSRRPRPRRGRVFHDRIRAGLLEELDEGFRFTYDPSYLADPRLPAVSLTLPKRPEPYESRYLFPFFFGLLAEGSTKDLQCRLLKIDEKDPFGRLLATLSGDVIGSVYVLPDDDPEDA